MTSRAHVPAFFLIASFLAFASVSADEVYLTDPAQRKDPALRAPHSLESEHFRIVWGRDLSTNFTADQARGTLRNFEAARTFFIDHLGMKPPGERDGKRYRLTIATMEGGYETGGGVINIDPSGLRVDPPSWVIPHELMHAFQESQGGHMIGDWWESHANYGAERWISSMPEHFAGQSEFDPAFATMSHWYLAHGRDYYLCWPIWCYLDENPDHLAGLGSNFAARMWREAREEEEFFALVKRLAPVINVQDLVGRYARRAVTWDYRNGATMRAKMDEYLRDETVERLIYPDLVPCPGEPGWMRVPPEMAPQQGGYVIHRLLPTSTTIRITFRGVPDHARGADWRVSLVVRHADGSCRYGPTWNAGEGSLSLRPGETNLFLVVAATPTNFVFGNQDELRFPWNTHPQRQRFPYVLRATGVAQAPRVPSSNRHRHPNGGGWVADSAQVDDTVFIGRDAQVREAARVTGSARVEDFAIVSDHAQVRDAAVVRGHARIRDWAVVRDEAHVGEEARVLQRATVREKAQVRGHATVEGCTDVWGEEHAFVGGDAVPTADYGGARMVTNGFQTGFVPYEACPEAWIATRTAPAHRFISYAFDAPNDALAKDHPGLTDGILLGSPRWRAKEDQQSGILTFGGPQDGIALERSAFDFRAATFAARIKWHGGTSFQPLFHAGTSATNFLTFGIDGATGRLVIELNRGDTKQRVTSTSPITRDRWCLVAATLDGTTARLYLDEARVAESPCPARPEDFVGTSDDPAAGYFWGRDRGGHVFAGNVDEIRIFSAVLDAKDVLNLGARPHHEAPENAP